MNSFLLFLSYCLWLYFFYVLFSSCVLLIVLEKLFVRFLWSLGWVCVLARRIFIGIFLVLRDFLPLWYYFTEFVPCILLDWFINIIITIIILSQTLRNIDLDCLSIFQRNFWPLNCQKFLLPSPSAPRVAEIFLWFTLLLRV